VHDPVSVCIYRMSQEGFPSFGSVLSVFEQKVLHQHVYHLWWLWNCGYWKL